jgi:hypothetical protein
MKTVPKPKAPRPLERDVQKAIVDALRLAGLRVRETSAWKQKAPSGVDKGIPDLLVFAPEVPLIYFGLEVKRDSKAAWTKEQKAAVNAGEYVVVTTPHEALQYIEGRLSFHLNVRPRIAKIEAVLRSLR